MAKKVILAGLLGGVALLMWAFVVNGMLGLRAGIDMKQVPGEREVYELLKESITAPGMYVLNPEVVEGEGFPGDEPVFSIAYSGLGHGSAGRLALLGLVLSFLIPLTGAWLMSHASQRTLSSFPRKVMFFFIVGILLALYYLFDRYGIARYPLGDALVLCLYDISTWVVVGLVIAWRMGPRAESRA